MKTLSEIERQNRTNNQVQVIMILVAGCILAYHFGGSLAVAGVFFALALRPNRKN